MRVAIPTLPSPASMALKTMLEKGGYLIVTEFPSYTVRLERGEHPWIVVDVPDAVFGRLLTHRIGERAPWDGVFVKAGGGNQNDKAALIEVPDDDAKALEAVCVGTLRALDQVQKIASEPAKVAGTPFLNASELLANAVEIITATVNSASATTIGTLTQVVTDSITVSDRQRNQMLVDLRTHQVQLHQEVSRHTDVRVSGLFKDLLVYYARPRWWQPRYWFPPK